MIDCQFTITNIFFSIRLRSRHHDNRGWWILDIGLFLFNRPPLHSIVFAFNMFVAMVILTRIVGVERGVAELTLNSVLNK